jgi:hypothetical protein
MIALVSRLAAAAAAGAAIGGFFGWHWGRNVREGKPHPEAAGDAARKTVDAVTTAAKGVAAVVKIKEGLGA